MRPLVIAPEAQRRVEPTGGASSNEPAASPAISCPGADAEGTRSCSAPEEASLAARGWTRRFVGDPRMCEEATSLYSRLGYEVMAVPLDGATTAEACAGCAVTLHSFRVIYTRRPGT